MEQILARLLAEMRINQEKTDAKLKEIRAGQKHVTEAMRGG
jgi:hypothetical protein